ncbi:helix-turn-helix domain-containing protein [Burkholderia gladioli]|uniref:helix-turn-helix domain-containing protein n=1 Tax=Burkholderia gladioli TaxID=28095 RepID=UPI0016410B6B|nr:helix-turn-helix domain-containing protein [Burkholderia gladioli]MBJ9709856.1 helix-turn-helix domain-containing protein [Burkholderia gladioli]
MNAKTIIEKLLANGLSQSEIQRRWGIPQATISHLYTGSRGKRTSYETMRQLEKALEDVLREGAR